MKRAWIAAALSLISCAPAELPPPAASRPSAEDPVLLDPNPVNLPSEKLPNPPSVATLQAIYKPVELVYLDPDEFPEAPPELRKTLRTLGCRIPQLYFEYIPADNPANPPHNLVSGYFKGLHDIYWAVICSRPDSSALLLFDSGGMLVEELEKRSVDPDYPWPQSTLDQDWYVDEADREHILYDHETFNVDGPEPPPIWHDGIESGTAEKSSHILYWHDCQWLRLQGGD